MMSNACEKDKPYSGAAGRAMQARVFMNMANRSPTLWQGKLYSRKGSVTGIPFGKSKAVSSLGVWAFTMEYRTGRTQGASMRMEARLAVVANRYPVYPAEESGGP